MQGAGANGFVRGGGQFFSARRDLNIADTEIPLFTVPGIGSVTASCKMGTTYPEGSFGVKNLSGLTLDNVLQYPWGGTDGGSLLAGATNSVGGYELIGSWTWQFASRSSPSVVATLSLGFNGNASPTACAMLAQATEATG